MVDKTTLTAFFILVLVITSGFAHALPAELEELFARMEAKGARDIVLVYDWGDGHTDELPRDRVAETLNHHYREPGTYRKTRKLRFVNPVGRVIELPIDSREIVIRDEPTPGELSMSISPTSIDSGDTVTLKAEFNMDPTRYELEREPRFEWFIDDEYDPYQQGMRTSHQFFIPNGPEKPYYTVTLKARFRWRRRIQDQDGELWRPGKLVDAGRVQVRPGDPPEIIEVSEDVTGVPGELVDTPVFVRVRYRRIYEREDDFVRRADLLRPRVLVGKSRKGFEPEFVAVRINRPTDPPYSVADFNTELIWMVNPVMPADLTEYDADGVCMLEVSVPDPRGRASFVTRLVKR